MKMLGEKERQCIVTSYNGMYWDGTAGYSRDFYKVKVFKESEVPEYVKNDSDNEIIFLDSEKGLEVLAREYEILQGYVDLHEQRINDAKKGMDKLLEFKNLQKYIQMRNERTHPLIGINEETKKNIIKDILKPRDLTLF